MDEKSDVGLGVDVDMNSCRRKCMVKCFILRILLYDIYSSVL